MGFNPKARTHTVEYVVNATGDRWFIPYNDQASKANQVTRCSTVVGLKANGTTPVGVERLASA